MPWDTGNRLFHALQGSWPEEVLTFDITVSVGIYLMEKRKAFLREVWYTQVVKMLCRK